MSEPYLGEIKMVAFSYAPRGYSVCEGQLLPVAQNQALFSLLGCAYGGDCSSTFALPDLRGRVPISQGTNPANGVVYRFGTRGGSSTITLGDVSQLPLHTHAAQAVTTLSAKSLGSATLKATNGSGGGDQPAGNVLGSGVQVYNASPRSLVDMSDDSIEMTEAPVYTATTTVQVGNAGQCAPIPYMPPYQVLQFCIAINGLYPPRS